MKRRIVILLLVFLINVVGCTRMTSPARENMLKNKSFVYLFFDSEEECLENQQDPDFFENCHQQVNFLPDNEVELMLSDIIWRGSYYVEENLVILKFGSNPEIPEGELIFEILNGTRLLRIDNGTVWKKISGDNIWK